MAGSYEIKRGHAKNYDLKKVMKECFGDVKEKDGKLHASFGAIRNASASTDGKTLEIDTEMDKTVSADVAAKTVSVWNDFLLKTTGFTSKERLQRLKAKAKKGEL
ncbi:MAG: hypothetical protein CVT48_01585 [Thermoplasmata archaeon HGW-Thermoplasmata-1]|nr:MAG: hypothetical protein CVT48_01585 [Thermoplasmata archaeon HGW-Thermoplasmata-1]